MALINNIYIHVVDEQITSGVKVQRTLWKTD